MALLSMTGFSRRDGVVGTARYAWEIRSVNGRGLDLRFRLPAGYDALEARARAKAGERLARGNVSVSLQVASTTAAAGYRVNEDLLALLIETARRHAGAPGLRDAAIDGLLAVKGVVEPVEADADPDAQKAVEAGLYDAFLATLDAFVEARAGEGAALARLLLGQVAAIEDLVAEAEALPTRTPEAIRQRLADQLALLLARDDLDQARLHQEAALIATRQDVREELDRLKAHVAQARELVAAGTAVGRRLDFLAQEFNREANTLCSKANDTTLTRIGLSLKAVVDQFKEQVQNVE